MDLTILFLLDIHLGVELLGQTVTVLLFEELPIFQSGCTILQSYQQYLRVLISPYPHHHLLLSVFFIIAILVAIVVFVFVF